MNKNSMLFGVSSTLSACKRKCELLTPSGRDPHCETCAAPEKTPAFPVLQTWSDPAHHLQKQSMLRHWNQQGHVCKQLLLPCDGWRAEHHAAALIWTSWLRSLVQTKEKLFSPAGVVLSVRMFLSFHWENHHDNDSNTLGEVTKEFSSV